MSPDHAFIPYITSCHPFFTVDFHRSVHDAYSYKMFSNDEFSFIKSKIHLVHAAQFIYKLLILGMIYWIVQQFLLILTIINWF